MFPLFHLRRVFYFVRTKVNKVGNKLNTNASRTPYTTTGSDLYNDIASTMKAWTWKCPPPLTTTTEKAQTTEYIYNGAVSDGVGGDGKGYRKFNTVSCGQTHRRDAF